MLQRNTRGNPTSRGFLWTSASWELIEPKPHYWAAAASESESEKRLARLTSEPTQKTLKNIENILYEEASDGCEVTNTAQQGIVCNQIAKIVRIIDPTLADNIIIVPSADNVNQTLKATSSTLSIVTSGTSKIGSMLAAPSQSLALMRVSNLV